MRRPIVHEMRDLKTPRERMWEAMLSCMRKGGDFSLSEIEDKAHPTTEKAVADYLKSLASAQLAEQISPAQVRGRDRERGRYRLLVSWPVAPRVTAAGVVVTQGLGVVAMWRVSKILKTFTPADLARESSVGQVQVMVSTAKRYCLALAASGHFQVVTPGKPGTQAVYRNANNTGLHAPAITKTKCVFDRNTGEIKPIQTPQEVLDACE